MARYYMLRTPGTKDFPTLAKHKEGRVVELGKEDAEALVKATLAEPFDADNELHAEAETRPEEFNRLDARRGPKTPAAKDYDAMTLDDLHKEAAARNLEGRSGLDKAGLVKLLTKDDHKAK